MSAPTKAFEKNYAEFAGKISSALSAQKQHILVSSPPGCGIHHTIEQALLHSERPRRFVRTSILVQDEFLCFDAPSYLQNPIHPFRIENDVTIYEDADFFPDDALTVLETLLNQPPQTPGSQIVLATSQVQDLMSRLSETTLSNMLHISFTAPE